MTNKQKLRLTHNGESCSLTDCTFVVHKGTIYEPYHRRLTFVEADSDVAYGIALDADGETILQVEAPVLERTPRGRRNAEFRAHREAGKQAEQEHAAQTETRLTAKERHVPGVPA